MHYAEPESEIWFGFFAFSNLQKSGDFQGAFVMSIFPCIFADVRKGTFGPSLPGPLARATGRTGRLTPCDLQKLTVSIRSQRLTLPVMCGPVTTSRAGHNPGLALDSGRTLCMAGHHNAITPLDFQKLRCSLLTHAGHAAM